MFSQRRFFTKLTFRLEPAFVHVTERELTSSRSYVVPYENISAEPVEVMISSRRWLVAAIILVLLTILVAGSALRGDDVEAGAWLFWGTFAALAGITYYVSRSSYLVFRSGEPPLVVMKDRPSRAALDQFLQEVQQRKTLYLAQAAMTQVRGSSAADALQKLAYLRQLGVLNEEEFAVLKADILRHAQGFPAWTPPFYQ